MSAKRLLRLTLVFKSLFLFCMTRSFRLLIIAALPLLGPAISASDPPVPVADHHIHVPSEETAAYLKEAAGFDLGVKTGTDVVRFLDEAGIEKGVLLSLAYMFGRPGTDFPNEYAKVKQENDYAARQAAAYPDRLVAFCSVNPLADYALKEIERCASEPHLKGLKLQFGNSKIDLRDSSHVTRLAEVFRMANGHGLPIVVHVWTGDGYGRTDAEIFIREVLSAAPDVTVQVAHMGGAGMFSKTTVEAVKAFAAALENKPRLMDDVYFDLGAVTADPSAARAQEDTSRAKQYRTTHRRTARWIERVGPDRVVFGSDYFARSIPDYVSTLRQLPLKDALLRDVFDNRAPYLQGGSS